MSAAGYYNSQPANGREEGITAGETGYGVSHAPATYGDYNHNYVSENNQNISNYYGLSQPSSHSTLMDASYPAQTQAYDSTSPNLPPRKNSDYDSTPPIPGKYGDPYAENIPLHDRPIGYPPTAYNPGGALPPPAQTKPFTRTRRRRSWFCYAMAAVLTIVFVIELARNQQLTGSPIAVKPSFNPMIGPSPYVIINMGSRYVPCMQRQDAIANADVTISFPCPNMTTNVPECTLSELCGFKGTPSQEQMKNGASPNQWFRFILPMFLHAGFIHITFNMLLLLTLGKQLEEEIGPLRFALVYFSCGIFGFILGGNFAPVNISSVGASGALFGVLALNLLDLLYTWKERKLRGEKPVKELVWVVAELLFAFVLGLFPGLDNFAHIGGFTMGILLGLTVLHSPSSLRQRIGVDEPPYSPVIGEDQSEFTGGFIRFAKNPMGFFKGRKPLWWAWWIVRAAALVAAAVMFVVLLNNFYVNRKECKWCKYLSCLPVKNWCDIGKLTIEQQNPSRRLMLREL